MRCPECGRTQLKILDSRKEPERIYRRRQCLWCSARFSTVEVYEQDFKRHQTKVKPKAF